MTQTTIPFTPARPWPAEAGRRTRPSAAQIARHHADADFSRGSGVPSAVINQLDRVRNVRLQSDHVELECSENTLEIYTHGGGFVLWVHSGTQSFSLVVTPSQATLMSHDGTWRYDNKIALHLYAYVSRLYAVATRTREEYQALLRRTQQQVVSLGHKLRRGAEVRTRKGRASSSGPAEHAEDKVSDTEQGSGLEGTIPEGLIPDYSGSVSALG